MAIHSLQKTQKINLSISEVWDFISSPRNLKEITPDYMGFKIITDLPEKMYAGQIIQYKVTPLLNIPMSWCTEITHVKEHEYFVDEQRQGPYNFWHHQHHIKPIKNGVEMLDIVHYQAPFGIIGELVTPLIVTKKLEEIFEYRFNKLIQLFGEYKEG
jgi:ligand-binding SRPBCC domain-containing protein